MNTLLGSQPKAAFSTQPTIQPAQEADLGTLLDTIMQTFQAQAGGLPGQVAGQAAGALPAALGYQAPAGPAPIDATQAFQQGVVQPTTQDFLQRTLPSIAGNFGRGAGGAFGSESATARGQAGLDTTRALAQQGTQFAYDAARQNQQAQLAQNQIANQAASVRNVALAAAPGTAATLPNVQQPFLQDLLQAILQQTQQTSAVGTGGSTGLIQSFLGGAGGTALGTAGGNLLTSLLSGPSAVTALAPLAAL
jgi:hypothetical protein